MCEKIGSETAARSVAQITKPWLIGSVGNLVNHFWVSVGLNLFGLKTSLQFKGKQAGGLLA